MNRISRCFGGTVARRRGFPGSTTVTVTGTVTATVLKARFSIFSSARSLPLNESVIVPRRIPTPVFKYAQDPKRPCIEGDTLRARQLLGNGSKVPGIELLEVGTSTEVFLGKDMFSASSSLRDVFGSYNEIINLFTLRNANEEHPLFFLAKLLEAEGRYLNGGCTNPYPLFRGMMSSLATEMFGRSSKISDSQPEVTRSIKDRHARMVHIAEIAYITQQIHRRILDSGNLAKGSHTRQRIAEFNDANKTATLVGDLLWAQICAQMAALKSQPISEMICEFLMDYCEGEFVFKPKSAPLIGRFDDVTWFEKTQLGLGSILGTSISAMLAFNGHEDHVRNAGYRLGMMLALTYQAHDDIMFFTNESLDVPHWLDMGLLPAIQKVTKDRSLVESEPSQIFQKVKSDEQVFVESYKTLRILQEDTLAYIAEIEASIVHSRARDLLQQFILAL